MTGFTLGAYQHRLCSVLAHFPAFAIHAKVEIVKVDIWDEPGVVLFPDDNRIRKPLVF